MKRIHGWIARLETYVDRWWYNPLIAFLTGIDLFIAVIPSDGLVISSVMLRPRRWISVFCSATIGSSCGAMLLATLTALHGEALMSRFFPHALNDPSWVHTAAFLAKYGHLAMFLVAVGPLPQQPAVVLAALAHMNIFEIGLSVAVGRGLKYGFYAWAVTHAPRLMRRLKSATREAEAIHVAGEPPHPVPPHPADKSRQAVDS